MQEQSWLSREFVFVGGMHRSGTTLLAKIIAGSTRSSGLESSGAHMGEGQFLQDVYPIGKAYGGVTAWALDPRSHMTEAHASDPKDAGQRLWDAWSPHWNLSADYLVEKTPLNITKTRYLQTLFPRSRFVIITRHPISQALAVRKWQPSRLRRVGLGFSSLVENWVVAHERFRDDASALRSVLVIRYENLVSDPKTEVERLERFLTMSLPAAEGQFDGSRASSYEDDWRRLMGEAPLRTASGAKQRMKLAAGRVFIPRELRVVRETLEPRIERLGYSLDDLTRADDWPEARSVGPRV